MCGHKRENWLIQLANYDGCGQRGHASVFGSRKIQGSLCASLAARSGP